MHQHRQQTAHLPERSLSIFAAIVQAPASSATAYHVVMLRSSHLTKWRSRRAVCGDGYVEQSITKEMVGCAQVQSVGSRPPQRLSSGGCGDFGGCD